MGGAVLAAACLGWAGGFCEGADLTRQERHPRGTPRCPELQLPSFLPQSRTYLGMSTLRDLIFKRPSRQFQYLHVLLDLSSHEKDKVTPHPCSVLGYTQPFFCPESPAPSFPYAPEGFWACCPSCDNLVVAAFPSAFLMAQGCLACTYRHPPPRNGGPFRSYSAHVSAPPLKAWCHAGTWGGTDQEGGHCDHTACSVSGVESGVRPGREAV